MAKGHGSWQIAAVDPSSPLSSLRFGCAGCGAPLKLAASGRELRCERCGMEAPVPQTIDAVVPDAPIEDCRSVPAGEVMEGKAASCSGCGATFSAATLAATCVHCGGALSACPEDLGVPKPHGVLPFTIDEETARANAEEELGPSVSPLRRAFLPAMVLSVEGHVYYEGMRQDEDGKNTEEIVGQTDYPFDHRMVLGSTEQAAIYCPSGAAWQLGFVEPFEPRWLVGSECEHTTIDAHGAFEKIRAGLAGELVEQAAHEIGGRLDVCKQTLGEARYRYVLLPAWMGTYPHKGVEEHFLVHGRSGEVHSSYSVAREDRAESRRLWWAKIVGGAGSVFAAVGFVSFFLMDALPGRSNADDSEDLTVVATAPAVEVDPIHGTVRRFATEGAVYGARVWIDGQPAATGESDSRGEFEVPAEADGGQVWIVVDPTDDYLGTLLPADLSDRSKPVRVEAFARDVLAELEKDLDLLHEGEDIIRIDPDRGMLIVSSDRVGIHVTLDPSPPIDPHPHVFAPDEHSTPRLGLSTIEYEPVPYAMFFDLPQAEPGAFRVRIEGEQDGCRVDVPEPRVRAGHVTFLHVYCGS